LPSVELRWDNRVVGVSSGPGEVEVTVATADGEYTLACDWLIAADGSRSTVRRLLGVEWEGQVFQDRFLIADIHMTSDFPTERWFWFDPPFHPNQSTLLHRQADDVWRIDFQLGWNADPEEEKKPERILPRLRAMLGESAEFRDRMGERLHVRLPADAALSPRSRALRRRCGARRLAVRRARRRTAASRTPTTSVWKLDLVLKGYAPDGLLDTYDFERTRAADENILNSTRATDFITPKSTVSRMFRDAVLALAKDHAFARKLVNSGRLSVPAILHDSPLNTRDRDEDFARGPGTMMPGAPAADAPVTGNRRQLAARLRRRRLRAARLRRGHCVPRRRGARRRRHPVPHRAGGRRVERRRRALDDIQGSPPSATTRGRAPSICCARPARLRALAPFDLASVRAAIARATCNR
jgi:3-(3-hydroxy-phenyl)propionate hydroxylase